MQNGRLLKSLVLGVSMAWLGGCDSNAMPSERAAQFSQAGDTRLVDAGHGRIWTLTREGLSLRHIASAERRAIALPGWVMAGPPFGAEPALAFGPGGDVLVTSDVLPTVWRVDPRTLAVSVHRPALDAHQDKDFGFTRIAYSARDGVFVAVSATPQARWRIDAALARAEEIR
jgi:hypothetical protein